MFADRTTPIFASARVLLLVAVPTLHLQAQTPEVLISEGGTQVYCNALFYDSGGPNGTYSNNESHTITFCPGNLGDSIQIGFNDVTIVNGDLLTIYDGPNTSSPVLTTSATALSGTLWTAQNSGGCITIQFISNGSGVASGWTALIQCTNPCPQPTAYFPPFPESPYKVCPYDTLLINGGGSYPAPGRTLISYAWTIAGVTTFATDPTVLLPVPTPGQFPISLVVTDDIGCMSTNSSAELVRVGTYPDYTGTGFSANTICDGSTVTLTGSAEGSLWSSVPEPLISGVFVLPDACPDDALYTSALNVSGFPAGTTVNGNTDILQVCITMEHSYLGDLTVSLQCPDGASAVLFDGYNNGGGGTYLGSPLDNSTGIPGTGFQYCFTPSATWGTITDENQNGNWVTAGDPPGNSMAPGTYTPQDPFSVWDGCNLNGTWTVSVLDQLCIDDGVVFNVSMDINPALYPDVIEFTPTVGSDCDSSHWSGPFISNPGPDCNVVTATPDTYGTYDYVYTVTDNFGCTYDTTFHLTVTPGAVFEATAAPPAVCGNPIQLGIHFTPPMPQGAITYNWSPAAGLSNPNSAFPIANPPVPTWYRLHAFPAGHPECGMVDSVRVNPLTTLADDSLIVHPLCYGIDGTVQVITTGTGGPWDYTWKDAYGNVVQTTVGALGDSFTGPAGLYKAIIKEGPNGNNCKDSLTAEIIQPDLLQMVSLSNDTTICLTGLATLTASAIGGTEPLQLNWNNALPPGGFQMVSPLDTTVYVVSVSDANNCPSDTLEATVNVRGPLAFILPDTLVVCPEVDTQLFANLASGGDGAYAFDWGSGPSPDTVRTVNLTASQNICVTLTDGCETPALPQCTYFDVLPIPVLELSADTVLGCAPFHVTFTVKDTTGGATVDWNFGTDASVLAGPIRDFIYSLSGYYDVTAIVHWPNGCNDTTVADNMIRVVPIPKAEFIWSPNPASVLAPTLTFTEQAGPWAVDYLWQFAGADTASGPTAVHTFPEDVGGVYPVTLRVENYLGCADSVMRLVEIHDQFLVFTPNAFTPDGDGLNDFFFVQGNDIDMKAGFDLRIFDRWGKEIFATNDPTKPWDGRLGGSVVKNGVYVWKLKARSAYTQNDHEMLGHVSVVR